MMNNKKNKNKDDIFLYNNIINNRYKIKIIIKAKIALVGIFSINTSKGFQNLLLMHLFISLINFKGDSIIKLNLINNYLNNSKNYKYNKYYSLQEFQEDNNDEIIKNKILNVNKIDFLELSIYDKYFLKSCVLHFEKVFNILTKKEDINLTFTKFLDLYIIDISSDILLFYLNEITNKYMLNNNTYYKYYKNKNIFKEILFHSHQLFNSYTSKFGTKFIKDDTSQRFIKFECTSTYPRILFIIKFIPVLKGLIIIHIYYQSKLSRVNNNASMNNENRYKEVDLVFGSFLGESGEMDLKYVMPKKLENIEKFAEEFFVTTRNNDLFKLNEPSKEFKYFNYNIIKIINSIPIDSITPFQKIFEYINEKIKEKYKEEKENKKKKFIKIFLNNKKNISELNDDKNNESNINTLTIKKEKDNNESNDSLDKILLIDKNILYDDLFPNQSIKFSTIHNNFSTIKSNNKNIINILRESDSSIANNINFNKQKINDIKEEENTKTLNLMTESNLLSKEDEIINKELSKDFSLISSINKNDNNNLFKLKFHKKENTNLKNLNLLDLLIDTSNITNTNNIKEKIKHTEESVSDLINKEYNNNSNSNIITIKKKNLKTKKGKQRNKLVLMNDDI